MAPITESFLLFKLDFVQWALAASLVAGLLCGLIGPFIVWKRLSLLGNTVSHAAFTPLALASYLKIPFAIVLAPFSVGISLLLARIEEKALAEIDSILSVLFAGFMGIGVFILAQQEGGSAEAVHLLFGDILTVSKGDFAFLLTVTAIVAIYLWRFRRPLHLMVLNPELAIVEGVPVRKHTYFLLALAGLAVAACLKLMGVTLMTSLMVVPPLTAQSLTRSLKNHITVSVVAGILLAGGGLSLSVLFDLPSGATISALCLLVFFVSFLLRRS